MNVQIQDPSPDLILFNGRFSTLDSAGSMATAVAIKNGYFVAVGSDTDIGQMSSPRTEQIDLDGKMAIPGIFDSHNHMLQVGVKLTRIRLDECRSPEEMMELVRERAADTPPGDWIIGEGWNENIFEDGRLPTRHDIDPATDRHPVILMRFFNMDVVNSVALRLAGVDRGTPDPEGGRIERDADGQPNGILRAAAKLFVRNLLPQPTLAELVEAIRLGCEEMHRHGIASVIDPGLMPFEVAAYQAAYDAGLLSVRTNMMLSWHGFRDEESEEQLNYRAVETGLRTGLGDEWLRLGGLKMAIDGGTSSHTAYMYDPFEGEFEVRNYNRLNPEQLRRYFRMAQEHGWDVGIHTCGDRAMDMVVEAFADAISGLPNPDARHNVIHAYFPSERAIDLMVQHNIGAVIQPTFLYWEGDMIFRDVGHARAANYKPARTFLDRGIPVAANSDIPSTVSVNPFPALYALVTRRNNAGNLVAPDQAISREDALRAYTTGGTWLTREESLKGSIEVGKVADLAVLDRDFFAVPDEEILEIGVEMTIVGGQRVFEA